MFILNPDQQFIVSEAVNWFKNSNELIFQYDGPPGSGKSVVLNEIVRQLKLDIYKEVAPMSYIGAASLVMRTKGLYSSRTAHSWCYDIVQVPRKDSNGNIIYKENGDVLYTTRFVPKKKLDEDIKLIIIDEAYCMPLSMRPVIENFGIKILACGDQNQLPPVKDAPAFLNSGKIYHLTQIMRQIGIEDIVFIANRAMRNLPLLNGYYGHSMVIERDDLSDSMLLWADVIICCTNRTRDKINAHIRYIKGYTSPLPCYGERLVCRNNNWLIEAIDNFGNTINLVNGLIGTVENQPGVEDYNRKNNTFKIVFRPDLVPECVFTPDINYDYITSDYEMRQIIKNDRYEEGMMFEYAYAITCHISQGSQFHKVIYIEESMGGNIQHCLNLVGPTRADQQLIYVKNNYKPWKDYNDPVNPKLSNTTRISKAKERKEKDNTYKGYKSRKEKYYE